MSQESLPELPNEAHLLHEIFGSVEQSYRDPEIDYEQWREFALEYPDITVEALHEANRTNDELVTPREAFLRGLKFATRLKRSLQEAAELNKLLEDD